MPPPKPTIPPAAKPRYGKNFDPWNSSGTGHQRPDNTPGSSTGWRESRSRKLTSQFRAGGSGGQRLGDTWGPGAEGFDKGIGAVVEEPKGRSVIDMLMRPASRESTPKLTEEVGKGEVEHEEAEEKEAKKGIFQGVVVYVNGSTFPHISDHKLKQVLSENGGQMAIHLGRRKVTHVIVGRPNSAGYGAGGGLAGGKLDKEIRKMRGVGVKFVGVEWVLESLKACKRLPEARFVDLKVVPKSQRSVYGLYAKQPPMDDEIHGTTMKKTT
ncbi:uncharacterized protein F5Z01DRAFT_683890 [Emericellopsis atlantica]|uniref:BRCT domain-containing protein n=1 Tax=Emericellopsis atlantica TaxID=2614577 RepID=A0A9P8CKF2_9HYPO|nr:uncharacterized protein F5Z01DRAFT_683890 [Emericellopsis atlantica]KAG9250499.1 hypothetical protein F5Z01DRAFT_683890 [Emericellopsis atlantica]